MSAASLPKSDGDMPPSSGETRPAADAEGWQLLESLRRRLDEQVQQTRKTQGQVTQLADSIAALVAEQRKRSRWLNINSFAAYLVFTLLLGGAFYFLYQSRARELVSARAQAIIERDAAVRKADDATVRLVARESADAKAWEVYQLIAAGNREEVERRMAALHDAPLTRLEREVLADKGRHVDTGKIDTAVKNALASFKAGHFSDTIAPLDQALAIDPQGPRAAQLHYLLGIAHAKSAELDKAISHLDTAISLDVSDDDARFQLASALDRAGQWQRARVEYDRFATAHPQSQFAMFAMRRSATLARPPQPVVPAPGAGAGAGRGSAASSPTPAPATPPSASAPAPAAADGSATAGTTP
jgi:tetratricopeptide (TPR) repeat protein